MNTPSKERLEEIRDCDTCVTLEESAAMARELLALLKEREADVPDYIRYDCGCCGWETIEDWRENDVCPKCNHQPMGKTELYSAPPAQPVAVPDENGLLPCPFCGSPAEHYPDGDMEGYSVMCGHKNGDCNSWIFGFSTPEEAEKSWNTRAAMLNQAPVKQPASNSPVIPDGWVMLPAEPTHAMMTAWLSEVANFRGHAAGYRAMIAAAPGKEG